MIKDLATLKLNDALDLTEDIMNLDRIRHMSVVDDDKVVGIVSPRDLFGSALAVASGLAAKPAVCLSRRSGSRRL